MKKSKSVVVGLALIVVMMLSGCDAVDFDLDSNKTEETTKDQTNNNDNVEQETEKNSVYQSAEKTMTFLLDALDRKDVQAIKDKFSPYAKENISDFDAKIERFVDEFPGCNNDYKIKDTFYRHSDYGKITYIMTPSYDFTIEDKTYRMRIIYYTESDSDESKLGWYSVQLYERNNPTYSSTMYTHDVNDNPDILLWDYTKNQ